MLCEQILFVSGGIFCLFFFLRTTDFQQFSQPFLLHSLGLCQEIAERKLPSEIFFSYFVLSETSELRFESGCLVQYTILLDCGKKRNTEFPGYCHFQKFLQHSAYK